MHYTYIQTFAAELLCNGIENLMRKYFAAESFVASDEGFSFSIPKLVIHQTCSFFFTLVSTTPTPITILTNTITTILERLVPVDELKWLSDSD